MKVLYLHALFLINKKINRDAEDYNLPIFAVLLLFL